MNEFEEDRIRRAAVFAPIRMLSGFVAGSVLGILAFGLAWLPFWPSNIEGFIQAIVLLGTTALVAGSLGALTFAVRPIQRSWQLIMSVGLGTLGGVVAGRVMRSALMIDCLHGTGPRSPGAMPAIPSCRSSWEALLRARSSLWLSQLWVSGLLARTSLPCPGVAATTPSSVVPYAWTHG
jgi:hypothetical protein